ncbi:hypothetical protein AVEN_175607-1 [Araneus ventricosus]|uniref:Uncharacterized protein n=1 Tax=Araneus ventricosus TaxID=182803 RepID=A0A4Y2G452_ARAVE|nr:hypothetical protein AVEN_175607-1 [Araneus ventricosus]
MVVSTLRSFISLEENVWRQFDPPPENSLQKTGTKEDLQCKALMYNTNCFLLLLTPSPALPNYSAGCVCVFPVGLNMPDGQGYLHRRRVFADPSEEDPIFCSWYSVVYT